ncbi:MAG: hypothetical protein P0S94_04485, partial [Simkaniaceae bacterium]|nr:hypothetical protein [Simkaniaceae bacterium]
MKYSVYDLHCDLLGCVEDNDSGYDFDSPEINCSMPQLEAGDVEFQVFAVAAVTLPGSTTKAEEQIELFQKLKPRLTKVKGCIACENASVLAEEDEPFEKALKRFDAFSKAGRIAYVSLTWNCENRFGGG